jgi:integrase
LKTNKRKLTGNNIPKKENSRRNSKSQSRILTSPRTLIYCHPQVKHDKKKRMTEKETKEIDFTKPRDLYNRNQRLQTSLKRINELANPDRNDILAHVQYLKDNRRATLTIIRNISVLIVFRNKMDVSFRNATATDIRAAFDSMENKGWVTNNGTVKEYSSWADKKFRLVIKKFYRVVYGNDEDYPEQVRWIKTKFTKDKSVKRLDTCKFLSRDQIIKLIEIADGLQQKTLIAISYELGARPGELLALTNLNLREEDGKLFCVINEARQTNALLSW